MKRLVVNVVALSMPIILEAGVPTKSQYQSGVDRRAIAEIRKIQPPLNAVELKNIMSFPNEDDRNGERYLWQPHSFVRDSSGNYFITDTKANTVVIFNSNGHFINRFGQRGQGPGDLNMPMPIQLYKNNLIINEAANRRLQYFSFQGITQKTVRIFKTYCSLMMMDNGQMLGAPLFVDREDNAKLIEILTEDGKVIREFGTPIEFKYEQYSMNQRSAFLNSRNEIVQVFRKLPIIQKYSLNGSLLNQTYIDTGISLKKEAINRRMNSYLPNERVGYYLIFDNPAFLEDTIYLYDFNPPNLWIWAINNELLIIATYWIRVGEQFSVYDFQPFFKDDHIFFDFLATDSDMRPKILVFTPK